MVTAAAFGWGEAMIELHNVSLRDFSLPNQNELGCSDGGILQS
jgi:hypothetical protein